MLDANIDELNRSKFESNCKKDLENIEQNYFEKHSSLDGNFLKLKENAAISENHLPKPFENVLWNLTKVIKINNILTNTRTPVDSFINNLVEEKEILILNATQVFTPQEAIKQELKF